MVLQREQTSKCRLRPGEQFPKLNAINIHGKRVSIPGAADRLTHVQFRRFAGCPVCNLHLQAFVARNGELADAGIHEVVVFHSADDELLSYQGRFPFDVIGDPKQALYKRYGVGKSLRAVLDPRALLASLKGNLSKNKPKIGGMPNGGILGLPADFLVHSDGKIKDVHYGKHADDQWTVDEMLALVQA